jgi:uncharacterized OB-fold protein
VSEPIAIGDPLTRSYWDAAARHELAVQRCARCGHHQFYPRPFCLKCESDDVGWVRARGTGTLYSKSVVQMSPGPGFDPPYTVAVVELDEGPRLVTNLVEGDCAIGERVEIAWRARAGAPPLPVFRPARSGG